MFGFAFSFGAGCSLAFTLFFFPLGVPSALLGLFLFFFYRCTQMLHSRGLQGSGAEFSRSHSVDYDVEKVDMRAFFGEPELPLVVGSCAGSDPSGVGITSRVSIPSLAGLPLSAVVAPMIAASPPEGSSSLGHGSAAGGSQEGGVTWSPALLATSDTAPSATEAPPFSIGRDDPSRPTPS